MKGCWVIEASDRLDFGGIIGLLGSSEEEPIADANVAQSVVVVGAN